MTEEQINHMVGRFLGWRLPENFSPDAGISFKKTFNDHLPSGPQKHEPSGTNLFDAQQADAMIRHMIEGMPSAPIRDTFVELLQSQVGTLQERVRNLTLPIPMRLPCPSCGEIHIDEGEFARKEHHTHACQHCGEVWRPAVRPTIGVRFLPGFKNEELQKAEA